MRKYESLSLQITKIMEALQTDNMIANDHNKDLYKVEEIVLLSNGYIGALLADYAMYCINKIYIGRDGKPRISQSSVGPVIESKLDLLSGKFNWSQHKEYCPILKKWHINGTVETYAPNDMVEEAMVYIENELKEALSDYDGEFVII